MSDDRSSRSSEVRERRSHEVRKWLEERFVKDTGPYWDDFERRIRDLRDEISEIRRDGGASRWFSIRVTVRSLTTVADWSASIALRVYPGPQSRQQPGIDPPIGACFLLDLLLSKADREILPGDLEEEFATSILPKYGPKGARIWFWGEAVKTIARRNPVCRW